MTRALENLNGNQEKFGDSDWLKERYAEFDGDKFDVPNPRGSFARPKRFFQIGGTYYL